MQKTIEHSIEKSKAIRLVKKAISGKFAITKDGGDTLKVGAPMMTATIVITDKTIDISGGGAAGAVASTCASEIEIAVQEYQENQSGGSSNGGGAALSMEDQLKAVEAIKQFKELADAGIITQEEFEAKKKELLSASSGSSGGVQSKSVEENTQSLNYGATSEPFANIDSGEQTSNDNAPANDTLLAITRLGKIIYFAFSLIPFVVFLIGYITIFFIALEDYPLHPISIVLGIIALGCMLAYIIIVLSKKRAKGARIALNSVAFLCCALFGLNFFVGLWSFQNAVFVIMNVIAFGVVTVNLVISIVKK